ncbi:glycoside hydrolase family 10 protein [Deinococcus altitudinis]|uniref:glycoside hydrolase family 10 protein n=1 Tax=Deinococcus altitudinis TaxID=468914 RepID=UPI0038915608
MRPLVTASLLPALLLGGVLATTPPAPALQTAPAQAGTPVPVSPPVQEGVTPSGLRGLWVDAFGPGLRTPAEVNQMVSDAASLGFNTLFVQAIRRGDCLCLLSSVPVAADLQKAGSPKTFDPLAETIRLAHDRHMRVLAWVSVTGAYNSSLPSAGPTQVFMTHGPGTGNTVSLNSWLSRRPDGDWHSGADAWLDPGIPAAADYMAKAAVSLVRNYDLDGLQLDRIRYPDGGDWGYSPVTLARYRQETGAVGVPVPADERWKAWKREQVTALTRRVALESRALKPGVIISAATIVYGDGPADLNAFHAARSYSEVLQDWPSWMKEGLLDVNVIMNYKRDGVNGQENWFDRWNTFAAAQRVGVGEVAAGTSMYLNAPEVTAAQAGRALNLGLGWVGYAYRTPTSDVYKALQTQPQGLAALKTALDASPTVHPGGHTPEWAMTVQARRAVLGRVIGTPQPGGLSVGAFGPDGSQIAATTTDANGYYGFTDLPAGLTEVRVGNQRWAEPLALGVTRFPNLLLKTLIRAGK